MSGDKAPDGSLKERFHLQRTRVVSQLLTAWNLLSRNVLEKFPRLDTVKPKLFTRSIGKERLLGFLENDGRGISSSALYEDEQLARAFKRCADITRRASTNFYYAFMLLPKERRCALYAVYAFCRFVDDITDEGTEKSAEKLLDLWRKELDLVFTGRAERPISLALADTVARFRIPRALFEEIIMGVEMDLKRNRYQTFDDLKLYCRRVASAVGLICIEIFGYRNPLTRVYAEKLGIAFQLTNILRDVWEDARRGRIYIPQEDLEHFSVDESEIMYGIYSNRFVALMEFEAERARRYYTAALEALSPEDRPSLVAAEAMRLIYSALLDRIVRGRYRVFDKRFSVPLPHKLCLVARAWSSSRFPEFVV